MNEMRFCSEGEETLRIKDTGVLSHPGVVCPSIVLHIETKSNIDIDTVSGTSFSGGECPEFVSMPIYPIRLIPEGGVCRVETARQRCVHCGQMSWVDEVITCPGCQSQVFECV